ncbi:hypothetical protein [Cryptosporangium japonicum]|uniref:PE-PGRS family protein n=1 Tax=Cryptosporangium japonicum TaxID=80872 RepID=A0ABP3EQ43_9ACTN
MATNDPKPVRARPAGKAHPVHRRGPGAIPYQERPLILGRFPLTRAQFLRPPMLRPGVTAVYATAGGRTEHLDRMLTMNEVLSGRYREMFHVSIAARTSIIKTDDELRTRDDRFCFTTTAKVGWRVTDPATVVREQVLYAERAVADYVFDLMRRIGRKYEIRDCALAEGEINQLSARPIPMAGLGITVFSVAARLSLDDATQRYLRQQAQLGYDHDLQQRAHVLDVDQQRHENRLAAERLKAVAAGVQGEFGLITMYLTHHPGQSLTVLNMLHERQRELEQQQRANFADSKQLFENMLESEHFNGADLEEFREMLLRSMIAGAPTAVSGALPLASIPAPPALHASPSAAASNRSASRPSPADSGTEPTPASDPVAPPEAALPPEAAPPPVAANGVSGWRNRRTSAGGS